jgi:hypothetical protein
MYGNVVEVTGTIYLIGGKTCEIKPTQFDNYDDAFDYANLLQDNNLGVKTLISIKTKEPEKPNNSCILM